MKIVPVQISIKAEKMEIEMSSFRTQNILQLTVQENKTEGQANYLLM